MRWNPLFDAWSALRLDSLYGAAVRRMPAPLAWLLWNVRTALSLCIPSPSCIRALRVCSSGRATLHPAAALCVITDVAVGE